MGQGHKFSEGGSGKSALQTRGGKSILQKRIDAIIEKDPLLKTLVNRGTKINVEDVVFTAKDQSGMIVWLEKGNRESGLNHILYGNETKPGHKEDFKNAFKIPEKRIPKYIKKVISKGQIVQSKLVKVVGNREGFERVYHYKGKYHLITGIGTNGYIVSAYPYNFKK